MPPTTKGGRGWREAEKPTKKHKPGKNKYKCQNPKTDGGITETS